jgi:hypothetical protein
MLTSHSHPALYQKLLFPMVAEKSKHLLSQHYRGRLDGDIGDTAAFSDVYTMNRMSASHPGKPIATTTGPFEFVSESNMDFENFKDRPEFSDEHGGEGYSERSESPATVLGEGQRGRSESKDSARTLNEDMGNTMHPIGYHQTPRMMREYSPGPGSLQRTESTESPYEVQPKRGLLEGAAPMGRQVPGGYTAYTPPEAGQRDYFRR